MDHLQVVMPPVEHVALLVFIASTRLVRLTQKEENVV
jgi:hypothetical protein